MSLYTFACFDNKSLGVFVLKGIPQKTWIVNDAITCIVKYKVYSFRKEVDFLSNVISGYIPRQQHVGRFVYS